MSTNSIFGVRVKKTFVLNKSIEVKQFSYTFSYTQELRDKCPYGVRTSLSSHSIDSLDCQAFYKFFLSVVSIGYVEVYVDQIQNQDLLSQSLIWLILSLNGVELVRVNANHCICYVQPKLQYAQYMHD